MAGNHTESSIEDLAGACVAGEPQAWEEFVARTRPVVTRACARTALRPGQRDPALVEDLVQETYAKLMSGGLLAGFAPRHPGAIYGYLKVIATRVAQDHLKAEYAAKRGGPTDDVALDDVQAAAEARPPEDGILLAQIEACVAEISSGAEIDRDLLIFQLYYRLGLTAAAIASIPSLALTVKGVESFLLRLTRQIKLKLAPPPGREKAAHGTP